MRFDRLRLTGFKSFCEATDRLLLLCEMTLARAAPLSSFCPNRAPGATCGSSWSFAFWLSMVADGIRALSGEVSALPVAGHRRPLLRRLARDRGFRAVAGPLKQRIALQFLLDKGR